MHKIIFVPTYVCGKCYSPRLSVDIVVHSEILGLSPKGKIKKEGLVLQGHCSTVFLYLPRTGSV